MHSKLHVRATHAKKRYISYNMLYVVRFKLKIEEKESAPKTGLMKNNNEKPMSVFEQTDRLARPIGAPPHCNKHAPALLH